MLTRFLPRGALDRRKFTALVLVLVGACFTTVSCHQIKEGAALKDKAQMATKPTFQFWVQDAFVLKRPEGAVLAITGDVREGYANPGDELLIETMRGPVKIKLLGIERGDQTLKVVYPGNHVALIVGGIDKDSVKFGSMIVMARD